MKKKDTDTFLITQLGDFSTRVAAAGTLEDLAGAIAYFLTEVIPVDYSGFYLSDPASGRLRLLQSRGFTAEQEREAELTAGDRAPGQVYRSKQMLHVPNIENGSDPLRSILKGNFLIRSRLIMPVMFNDDAIGSFAFGSATPDRFSERDIAIISFACKLSAIAYNNILNARQKQKVEKTLMLRDRAIESSGNSILITDATRPDNPVIYVNPAFERLTGYSEVEILGRNPRFLQGLDNHQPGVAKLRSALLECAGCAVQVRNTRKNGTQFWAVLNVSPVFDEAGGLTNYVGVITDVSDRVKSEEEITSTSLRLSKLIESIQAGVLVEDESRHVVLCNKEFVSIFSIPVPPEELLGTDCSLAAEQSKHLFADPKKFVDGVSLLIARHDPITDEMLDLADGRVLLRDFIPIELSGTKQGHMWIYRDITEKVVRDRAIRDVAEKRRELLKIGESLLGQLSASSITSILAAGLHSLYGYDSLALYSVNKNRGVLEPLVARGLEFLSEDLSHWEVPLDRGILGSIARTHKAEIVNDAHLDPRAYYPDRAAVPKEHLLAFPLLIGDRLAGIIALNRLEGEPFSLEEFELTQFLVKYASLALENAELFQKTVVNEAETKAILGAIPDILFRMRRDGTITYFNSPDTARFQDEADQSTVATLGSLYPSNVEQSFLRCAEAVLQTGMIRTFEYTMPREGTLAHFEARVIKFGEQEVIATSHDITVRKTVEQELLRSKLIAEAALKAREDFFARMSHEIRTPMNGIMGLANLLAESSLTARQEDLLKNLRLSGQNLLVIINDILDLAKVESGTMRFESNDFSIAEAVQSVVRSAAPAADGKGLSLAAAIDDRIPPAAIGDRVRLTQVLTNLVTNAVKFTDRGSVTLEVKLIRRHGDAMLLEFAVRDTGIGIAAEKLPFLFQKFSQIQNSLSSRFDGTGLGLAIVKQLVELQGGSVHVESVDGKGSLFYFRLPLRASKKTSIEKPPPSRLDAMEPLAGIRVLVAEDNLINQEVITKTLELWNVKAVIARTGVVVTDLMQREQFDLVLMDVQMPDMDGFETTSWIRRFAPEEMRSIPIIAMTASVMFNAQQRCLEAGMDDYISKPFDPAVLHQKIQRILGRGFPSDDNEKTEPASGQEESHAFDLSYFRSISRGNEEFVKKSVGLYITQLEDFLARLKEAEAKADWKGVGFIAHNMKPAMKMIGQTGLAESFSALEQQIEVSPDPAAIAELLAEAGMTCRHIISELKKAFPNTTEETSL